MHVCVDDYSRLAYAEVLPNERATTAIAFLRRAHSWFERHGIRVQAVMTDNGSAYRSRTHAWACMTLSIKHLRTRPRRPRTNGKAERFIQTLLAEWAYSRIYSDSNERNRALPAWINHYNFTRRHGSLSHKPPGSRLNNAPGNYN
ncbi:MAG TPA: integrase core domain-containing protein [Solirubrobacteraceae bacterium]|nr:integrase core domain-containing protein [Solirubrobacteraceae bacterium]